MARRKVVIAGGGITALATAHYLSKFGCEDFVLLERSPHFGGLCRSLSKDGFTFDMTGHVLWRMDGDTRAFYEELLGDNLFWQDRRAAVATKGRTMPYPFQAHLGSLPPQAAYECVKGFLERDRWLRGSDLESWGLAMFGEGIVDHFFRPFNEKLFGVPLRELTWDWCGDVPVPTVDQILRGAILGETFQMKGNAQFAYPKTGGMQALVDALVARLGGPGERLLTGRSVTKVNLRDRVVEYAGPSGTRESVEYDRLVCTIPLPALLKIAVPQDGGLADFSSKLRANDVACVMLGFERPLTDLHWLYTPDREVPFYRLTFPTSTAASTAPAGMGSAMAEITVPPGVQAGVGDLVSSTLAGLRRLGLWEDERKNPVMTMNVEMISPAYVTFDLVRKHVPVVVEGFEGMGVYLTGRYGAWCYTSVSDNVAQGRATARKVLK